MSAEAKKHLLKETITSDNKKLESTRNCLFHSVSSDFALTLHVDLVDAALHGPDGLAGERAVDLDDVVLHVLVEEAGEVEQQGEDAERDHDAPGIEQARYSAVIY